VMGSGDWRAHSWFLERRFRERWGQDVSKVGVGVLAGASGGGVVIMIPDNGRDGLLDEQEEIIEAKSVRFLDTEKNSDIADLE